MHNFIQNLEQMRQYLCSVIYLSVVCLLYQGIANADLSIVSQLTHQYGNDWGGPLITALLFIGSGVGSLYNRYIGRLPYRYSLFIGSFGYTIFISIGLVFMKMSFSVGSLVMILLGSFLGGLVVSVFYNSLYNYINHLAKIDNEEVRYFGINIGFAQSSNIFGSVLSALFITPLGQFNYVLVMAGIILLISLFFLAVKQPPAEELVEEPLDSPEGSILTHQTDQNQQPQGCCNMEPYKLAACFGFTGVIIAFIYNTLSIIIYRTFDYMGDEELNRLTFIIFIFEGVGEIIGGIIVIIFSRRIQSPAVAYICISSLFLCACGVVLLGSYLSSSHVIGLGAALCGICDCTSMSIGFTLGGTWHKDGITAVNICQCLTVAGSTLAMVFLPNLYIAVLVGVLYIACVLSLVRYIKST